MSGPMSAEATSVELVVAPWAETPEQWVRVEASSPTGLLDIVRSADDAACLLACPDPAAMVDGEIDDDLWVATASLLVAWGVGALETANGKSARRLFGMQDAINLAGEEPETP